MTTSANDALARPDARIEAPATWAQVQDCPLDNEAPATVPTEADAAGA